MVEQRYDVLIVGAGHGGAQLASALRQNRFEGTIGLVGDEPDPPYERPPLSKEYLAGEKPFERILIRPERFWDRRVHVGHVLRFSVGARASSCDDAPPRRRSQPDRSAGRDRSHLSAASVRPSGIGVTLSPSERIQRRDWARH